MNKGTKGFFGIHIVWYEAIFIAISIATFKHSAWAYSVTMEGPQPFVDWDAGSADLSFLWSVGVLGIWYFFGGLMAVAVDVSMMMSAREIRNGKKTFIFAFVASAIFSTIMQLLFAAVHAEDLIFSTASLNVIPLQESHWMWNLLQWRIIILPLSLPLTATLYTVAIMLQNQEEKVVTQIKKQVEVKRIKAEANKHHIKAKDAATLTGLSYQSIIKKAGADDTIGIQINSRWLFSEEDLAAFGGRLIKDEA